MGSERKLQCPRQHLCQVTLLSETTVMGMLFSEHDFPKGTLCMKLLILSYARCCLLILFKSKILQFEFSFGIAVCMTTYYFIPSTND